MLGVKGFCPVRLRFSCRQLGISTDRIFTTRDSVYRRTAIHLVILPPFLLSFGPPLSCTRSYPENHIYIRILIPTSYISAAALYLLTVAQWFNVMERPLLLPTNTASLRSGICSGAQSTVTAPRSVITPLYTRSTW